MKIVLKIFFVVIFLPSIEGKCQNFKDSSSIYKIAIDEVSSLYSNDEIYYANTIVNELFCWFDSTQIPMEYISSFLKVYKDTIRIEFNFKKLNSNIKTFDLDYLNQYFYTVDYEKRLKYFRNNLIRFTSPLFDKKNENCIVCIDFWCGVDCGKIYFLYLKKVKNKWKKTKIEIKLVS